MLCSNTRFRYYLFIYFVIFMKDAEEPTRTAGCTSDVISQDDFANDEAVR